MEDPEELPKLALKGIEEFNRGEFYECHEYLEEAWMQEPRRVRFLYQGILQVGVGCYHLRSGNYRGGLRTLDRGLARLRTMPSECQGISVQRLVADAEHLRVRVVALGETRLQELDESQLPRVHLAPGEPDPR